MRKKTLRVITHLEAVSGTEEKSQSLLLELVELSRKQKGCLNYELLQNNFIEDVADLANERGLEHEERCFACSL